MNRTKQLCQRTLCIWRQGKPVKGMYCSGFYTGKLPCTGRYACHTCGRTMEGN